MTIIDSMHCDKPNLTSYILIWHIMDQYEKAPEIISLIETPLMVI